MSSFHTGFAEEKAQDSITDREWVSDDVPGVKTKRNKDRMELERKLVRKLDLRMSIIVVIYILNYVSLLEILQQSLTLI